jgi:AraC-type DNA-binding domain-containing proteins
MSVLYQNQNIQYHSFYSLNNSYSLHLHRQIEISLVMEGEIEISIGTQKKCLKAGDLAIVFPYELHELHTPKQSRILLIRIDLEYVEPYLSLIDGKIPRLPFLIQVNEPLYDSLKKAHGYYGKDEHLLKAYVHVGFCHILKQLSLDRKNEMSHHAIEKQMLLYIDEHFKEPLSLPILSKEFGVTSFYISRIFSKKLKMPFANYVTVKRIQYAKQLLLESQLSVTEIGYEAGFTSQRTFYRSFREQEGCSPLKFRKEQRKLL